MRRNDYLPGGMKTRFSLKIAVYLVSADSDPVHCLWVFFLTLPLDFFLLTALGYLVAQCFDTIYVNAL